MGQSNRLDVAYGGSWAITAGRLGALGGRGQQEKQRGSSLEPGGCSNPQPTGWAHTRTHPVWAERSGILQGLTSLSKGGRMDWGRWGNSPWPTTQTLLAQVWQRSRALLVGTGLAPAKGALPSPGIPFSERKMQLS